MKPKKISKKPRNPRRENPKRSFEKMKGKNGILLFVFKLDPKGLLELKA
jgi:hypothetical protein